MGLLTGTGTCFLSTHSTIMYGRGVSSALTRVVTTTSVSSMTLLDIMVSRVESPSMYQSHLTQPLIYGVYSPPKTFSLPLSGSVAHSGCGLVGVGGPLLHQSA